MRPLRLTVLTSLAAATLAACSSNPDGSRSVNTTAVGTTVGALTGAVLGRLGAGGNDNSWAIAGGTAGGAALGAGLGYLLDRQETELRTRLDEEEQGREVEVRRVRDDLLQLTLKNEVLFATDSASINPSFRETLQTVADVLEKYDRTRVQVVGHADSAGSDAYNQDLSTRRADAVLNELAFAGVPRDRMAAIGRGETEPRADNATADGRQLNRRVEVFVRPEGEAAPVASAGGAASSYR